MRRGFLLVLLTTGPVPAAPAQQLPDQAPHLPEACLEAPTPIGRALCFNNALNAADARVAPLLRRAEAPDLGLRAADLAAAQDHWRRYRDVHCGLLQRDEAWQGSEAPANVAACRLALTLRREGELRDLITPWGSP